MPASPVPWMRPGACTGAGPAGPTPEDTNAYTRPRTIGPATSRSVPQTAGTETHFGVSPRGTFEMVCRSG